MSGAPPGRRAGHGGPVSDRGRLVLLAGLLACCGTGVLIHERGGLLRAEDAALQLDPNSATRSEWMLLPDVGPRLSQALLAHRSRSDCPRAFQRLADLDAVSGVGPRALENWQPYLTFDAAPASGPTSELP